MTTVEAGVKEVIIGKAVQVGTLVEPLLQLSVPPGVPILPPDPAVALHPPLPHTTQLPPFQYSPSGHLHDPADGDIPPIHDVTVHPTSSPAVDSPSALHACVTVPPATPCVHCTVVCALGVQICDWHVSVPALQEVNGGQSLTMSVAESQQTPCPPAEHPGIAQVKV